MSHNGWNVPEPAESWQWDRSQIARWQVEQFNRQLDAILPRNRLYQHKLSQAGIALNSRLRSLEELSEWPFTVKQELVESANCNHDGLSSHQTYPLNDYNRLHRTSGTQGHPLMILDSVDDWRWWSATWQHVLESAQVSSCDRVFLAFSFGPFIGFWSAHQACVDRGAMVIPAGGLSTLARLEFLRQSRATVVCCTPTYAMHCAEVAKAEQFPLGDLPVDRIIVAGEVGGSLPVVRQSIETAWNAQVVDHAGATEVGPWGFGLRDRCGIHVIESSFIAEVLPLDLPLLNVDWSQPNSPIDASNGGAAMEISQCVGELVLTSLGRFGAPVIRYRTGDIVRTGGRQDSNSGQCGFLWLPEGIIGRTDDMLTVRGVNIFPSSVDSIVCSFPAISEYQVHLSRNRALDQIDLVVEASETVAVQLEKMLSVQLGLRVAVQCVATGSLPRSEGNSRRWVREK